MQTSTQEARLHYEKALHLGKKSGGKLTVLDDLLKEKQIRIPSEQPLGLVEIPIVQIVGTKTEGRRDAFSKEFYPALEVESEFAQKWISLCESHIEEGIRDPIKAYEYMNQFYIVEGNKRVSVLKYFGAPTITGHVIRILPPKSNDKETRLYYEFVDFYRFSQINYLRFTKEGSYAKLQKLIGKHPEELWTKEDRSKFRSVYSRFLESFQKLNEHMLTLRPEDAFLYLISLYKYEELKEMSYLEISRKVEQLQNEFKLLSTDHSVQLHMDPKDSPKTSLLRQLLPSGTPEIKAAFLHEKTADTSGWTYGHELGRTYLEQTFPNQVKTKCYDNVTEETAERILETAIADDNKLIFTTSPILSKASLKSAIAHPQIKILNCSLNTSHKSMRSYYLRMYELRFLLGVIAGTMTENNKIGYLVEYPIYGTAAVNAFALGAKMVNPNAKIYLLDERIAVEDENFFVKNDISIIYGKDLSPMGQFDQRFGLYRSHPEPLWNMAMPVWNWGKFYEQMIRNIINGSWKKDDTSNEKQGLNYWWGLSAGVLDLICSLRLPSQTLKLVDFLKESIANGSFSPFAGVLYSQKGIIQPDPNHTLTAEEIIAMDWLSDNIIGTVSKTADWNRGQVV